MMAYRKLTVLQIFEYDYFRTAFLFCAEFLQYLMWKFLLKIMVNTQRVGKSFVSYANIFRVLFYISLKNYW